MKGKTTNNMPFLGCLLSRHFRKEKGQTLQKIRRKNYCGMSNRAAPTAEAADSLEDKQRHRRALVEVVQARFDADLPSSAIFFAEELLVQSTNGRFAEPFPSSSSFLLVTVAAAFFR